MRFTTTLAFFTLLAAGVASETRAADLPTKARRPAAAPAKAVAKAPLKVVKPQAKPMAVRRVAAVAAPAASPVKVAAVASPQSTNAVITYSGIVLGPNELALPGACVYVAGSHHQMVVTNAQGEFALTLPASQTGSLQVAYAGLAETQLPMANNNHTAMFVTLSKK